MDLGLKIEKTNVGIKIGISKYSISQFLVKMGNFYFFGLNEMGGDGWSWVEIVGGGRS